MNYPVIGISGAARSGKDTICRALINYFETKGIKSERKSIAGDIVKSDLKSLVYSKTKINTNTEDNKEKTLIRPLLVEYGKLMRNLSCGRYFINKLKLSTNKITIIPDIRYAEYEKDELFWLKKEKNGFLIFVKHEFAKDANETEKKNNKILKKKADFNLNWSTLNENNPIDLEKINKHAIKIGEFYLKNFTTYLKDS